MKIELGNDKCCIIELDKNSCWDSLDDMKEHDSNVWLSSPKRLIIDGSCKETCWLTYVSIM